MPDDVDLSDDDQQFDPSGSGSALGTFVYGPDGVPLGRLLNAALFPPNMQQHYPRGLFIERPDGTYMSVAGGGTFLTGTGLLIDVDAEGNLRSSRQVPSSMFFGADGGGGGSFSSSAAGMAQQHAYDVDLLNRRGEIDLMLDDARSRNDRETQLILLRERERIDRAAEERGWQREIWIDAVRRWHELEVLGRQQTFEAEQNRLARENALRQQAIGELGGLQRQWMQNVQQARELLASTLGGGPFYSAALLRGGVLRGTTPTQAFRSELEKVVASRPQQVNLQGPLPELLQAIQNFPGQQMPTPASPTLGFRGGGDVSFTIQPDNPSPDVRGNTGVGILVGEGGPEVLEVSERGVRVIPLVSKGQGGLEVDFTRTSGLGTRGLAAVSQPVPFRVPPENVPRQELFAPMWQLLRPAPPEEITVPSGPKPVFPTPITLPPISFLPATAQTAFAAPGARPTTVATQQTAPLTPGQQFVVDLLEKWPNISPVDAAQAMRYGLNDLAQMINGVVAGTLDPQETYDQIKAYLTAAGEEKPPTATVPTITVPDTVDPAQARQFLQGLLDRWPNITATDADLAGEMDWNALRDLILQLTAGLSDWDAAYAMLKELLSSIELPPGEDTTSLEQAIRILYDYLGISPGTIGEGMFGALDFTAPSGMSEAELFAHLGWRPRVFRNSANGQVFVLGNDGRLYAITQPGEASNIQLREYWGIDPSVVITATPEELAQYGELGNQMPIDRDLALLIGRLMNRYGFWTPNDVLDATQAGYPQVAEIIAAFTSGTQSAIMTARRLQELLNQNLVYPHQAADSEIVRQALALGTGAFPLRAMPIIEPRTGMALPDPRTVVGLLNMLERFDPTTYNLLANAWEVAGYPIANIAAAQSFFTPTGTAVPGGVRFG